MSGGAAVSVGFVWDLIGGIRDINDGSKVAKQLLETADGMGNLLNAVEGEWPDDDKDKRPPPTCPKGHALQFLGTGRDNGWACDGNNQVVGRDTDARREIGIFVIAAMPP